MEIEWNEHHRSNIFNLHRKREWIIHGCCDKYFNMFCDKHRDCSDCECASYCDNHSSNNDDFLSRWISCIECEYWCRSFVSMVQQCCCNQRRNKCFLHCKREWIIYGCCDEHFDVFCDKHGDSCYSKCASYCDDHCF